MYTGSTFFYGDGDLRALDEGWEDRQLRALGVLSLPEVTAAESAYPTPGVHNRFGYRGYWFEPELGVYFVRHRVLDPRAGRWLTRDPIGYAGGWNLYRYVEGRPLGASDPWGLDSDGNPDQWHHMIPQNIRTHLIEHGAPSSWIDQKEFGKVFFPGMHTSGDWHNNWSEEWRLWKDESESAGRSITPETVKQKLNSMKEELQYREWFGFAKDAPVSYSEWNAAQYAERRSTWIARAFPKEVEKTLLLRMGILAKKGLIKITTRVLLPAAMIYFIVEDAKAHGVVYAVINTTGAIDLANAAAEGATIVVNLTEAGIKAGQQEISQWVDDGWYNKEYMIRIHSGFTPKEAVVEAMRALEQKREDIEYGPRSKQSSSCGK